MIVNGTNLQTLGVGFNAAFRNGLSTAPSFYKKAATPVKSITRENEYGWLGQMPSVREWIGDRLVIALAKHGYVIRNKTWEMTIGVSREDIEDDNVGIFAPLFTDMGFAAEAHKDQLVFGLMKEGRSTACFDGQYFFDTDHPVLAEGGRTILSASNMDVGGDGPEWFLIDDSRPVKPIILQERRDWTFTRKDDATRDDNVFERKEYLYGVDGRHNVGFGFWQTAWSSKLALTPESYQNARTQMMSRKADGGRVLAINPRLLVVPPLLEGAAKTIVQAQVMANGATNVFQATAEVVVVPWLA